MAAGSDREFSTLEVVPWPSQDGAYGQRGLPLSDPGKYVHAEQGKIPVDDQPSLESVTTSQDEKEASSFTGDPAPRPGRRSSKRAWIMGIAMVAVVIVLAAVLGGVLGSRAAAKSSQNSSTAPPAPESTSGATPSSRNIAAISFNSTTNSRVYLQDDSGQIIELGQPFTGASWATRETGIMAKQGSPIAAAVAHPAQFLPIISVFYLDTNGILQGIQSNTMTPTWQPINGLGASKYTPMPKTDLAAMSHDCALCPNTTLVAFQDQNGVVQIANSTSTGWELTQPGPDMQPQSGTGLALQPSYQANAMDQVDLYYQKSDLNMSLATWRPGQTQVNGWDDSNQTYAPIPPGSPIAAAASYTRAPSGYEAWIEVLSLSSTGVRVNTWSGQQDNWLNFFGEPSSMANSSNAIKSFGSVAINSIGMAFAVVAQNGKPDEIDSWLVGNDTLDWTSQGTVDLGGAWG